MKKLLLTLLVIVPVGTIVEDARATQDYLEIAKRNYLKWTRYAYAAAQKSAGFSGRRAQEQGAFNAGIRNPSDAVAFAAYTRYCRFVSDWIGALLEQAQTCGRTYARAKAYYYTVPAAARGRYAWLYADMMRWLRDTKTVDGYVRQLRDHKAKLSGIYWATRRQVKGR